MKDLMNLKEGNTYLIKPIYSGGNVKSITILTVTNEAYKIKWNDHNQFSWEIKSKLDADNHFIEDITTTIAKEIENFKREHIKDFNCCDINYRPYFLKTEPCSNCGGIGHVVNFQTTAGTITCPVCNGSGKQSKRIDILFE
jgi:hypothetical protein